MSSRDRAKMMAHCSLLVVVVVTTALTFNFTHGFHDTANAAATSIATGALRPRVAVLTSGGLNLAGAFLSTKIAQKISSGIVNDRLATPSIILAGLVGAIRWNLATGLCGLPSSSSHALFGGLIGAHPAYRISRRIREGPVSRGFRHSRPFRPHWSPSPTGPTTRRRQRE